MFNAQPTNQSPAVTVRRRCSMFRWGVIAVVLSARFALSADFHVSTAGRDTWSGRLPQANADKTDGPFASLVRARDAVRELVPMVDRDIEVEIRGGTYRLKETVVFTLADCAPEGHSVIYASASNELAVFVGAVPVAGWRKASPANVWVADVTAEFRTLYDGDGMLPRARSRGFSPVNMTPRGTEDYQTVQFAEGAVRRYERLAGLELRIVPSHFWIMNLLPIESIDYATRTLRTAEPGTYPLGRNGMTDRDNAWVENAIEDLDEPGEWVLDRAQGRLYLWPWDGKEPKGICAPVLTELVRVEGDIDYDGPVDAPVAGLVLRGLTFTQGDAFTWHGRTGWGVQHDWECFDKPTALVRFRGAERCTVEDCTFRHSGHTAVRLDLQCRDIDIVGNHIHHIGGVGVLLAGYGPGSKNVNRNNRVLNNYIHHIGLQYWGSAAIFAWQSGENRIAHNLIHDIPYTGILSTGRIVRQQPGAGECTQTTRWHEVPENYSRLSWRHREPYLHSRKNVIELNEIHHAMQRLGDGNCIYVSGAGGGTVVRSNHCHHCYGEYMNAAIRCDDDQHDTRMEGNVIYQTCGYGEGFISKGDNDIINNVIADLRGNRKHRGYIVFPYGEIKGTRIERNVLYSTRKGQVLYLHSRKSRQSPEPPRLEHARVDSNLYFCVADSQWAAGHLAAQRRHTNELHSVENDPRFKDIGRGELGFEPGSPARALGITKLDTSRMGLEVWYRDWFPGGVDCRTYVEPDGGVLIGAVTVTVSTVASQAFVRESVHYTLDGSEPTAKSTPYTKPFVLAHAAVVRARAFYGKDAVDHVGARAVFTAPPAIREDFEAGTVGATVSGTETHEDGGLARYTARVTDELAAGGTKCLRFADGPGQERSYTPHVIWRERFAEGTLVGRFKVRVDAASHLSYQWRHYEGKYATGPRVDIEPGGRLRCGGEVVMEIPLDAWVGVEVRCGVGDDADGTFELSITLSPGNAKAFKALPCDRAFRRLDWVGLATKATKAAICFVDDVEVRMVQPFSRTVSAEK